MPGMAPEDEGAEDMYCFRCSDRETGVSDVFVHIDILWEDFAAKLSRRFQRPVFVVYRREGEEQERDVLNEADFEDLCEYLDDTQLQTLPVEVRTLRQKRDMRRIGGPADGGGLTSESPRPYADLLGPGFGVPVPRDRLASAKPGQGKQIRPATAGARQQTTGGRPRAARQPAYGALQKPKSAWEGAVKEDRGASPRNRRTVQNTMGAPDKESMQDRITALQRQVTDMTDERKQLLAESKRLEKELHKVLLENEELFKAKGGNLFMKVGASSNEVHVMKKRIKQLEAEKKNIERDMDKLKSDTKVTRLTELGVERNTYLQEVRRLQKETKLLQEDNQTLRASLSQAPSAEGADMDYNNLQNLYQDRCRELGDVKREARKMQIKAQEAEEDRRLAEDERDKFKAQLLRVRQTSGNNKGEGSGVQRGVPRDWGAQKEALEKEIKELKQVQKRLDLALARANRERDTADAERADREEDNKKLLEQKRALQMQLHSLGAGSSRRPGEPHKIADRSDMICFFCQDVDSNHVEVQFVDFRVKYRDFCDILQRLYGRPAAVTFSYLLHGEEVVLQSEEDFTRCKEVIEDTYCGRGDQAMVITVLDQRVSMGSLDNSLAAGQGPHDGGAVKAAQASPPTSARGKGAVSGGSGMLALDTSGDDWVKNSAAPTPAPTSAPPPAADVAADFTFACYVDSDTHLGDICIADGSPWAEMCGKLREVAGEEATFTFPNPAETGTRVVVSTADEWTQCLDLFRKHREDLDDKILEIDVERKGAEAQTPAPPAPPSAPAAAPADETYEDEGFDDQEEEKPREAPGPRNLAQELSQQQRADREAELAAAELAAAEKAAAEKAAAEKAAAEKADADLAAAKKKEEEEAAAKRQREEAAERQAAEQRQRQVQEEAAAAAAAAAEEERARREQADVRAREEAQQRQQEEEAAAAALRRKAEEDTVVDEYGDDFEDGVQEEPGVVGEGEAERGHTEEEPRAVGSDDYEDEDFNDDVPVDDDFAEDGDGFGDGEDEVVPDDTYEDEGFDGVEGAGEVTDESF